MSKETHYEELTKKLDFVQSNSNITKILDSRLSNCGQSPNYSDWINSSLQFLKKNEKLFIDK